jgi:TolA-binding protein
MVAVALAGTLDGPVVAQEQTPAATRQYAVAGNLQNKKSYELAAEAWQEFIDRFKTDPRVGEAHYNLGVCLYFAGKLDSALSTFQKVTQQYPKLERLQDAYLYLGATQYGLAQGGKREMCDEAVRTFDALVDKFPQGAFVPDALYYKGECLYMRDKRAEAIRAYRRLLDDHPKHALAAEATYALGVCQEELGQHQEAAKTYDAFLKAFGEHELAAEVSLRRGEALLALGQHEEAARQFAAAAAAEGFELADHAAIRAADCLAQAKRYVEAAARYEAAIAKFPESERAGRAAVAAGKCHYLAGKYDEARKSLLKILSAGGEAAYDAAHWVALSWLKDKQPAKALEAVEKVLAKALADKSPAAAQLMMDRADAVFEIPERSEESIELYARLAEKYPDDPLAPQAAYMAGFAALKHGETATALKHAGAFLAAHTDHELTPDVTHIKAESLLLLKRFPEAEAQYAQLLERYPDHADAVLWRVRRGLALHLQKKYREAIDALEPAVREIRRPDLLAEARYLIGSSRLELDEHREAVAQLEASIEAQPTWRQADETLLALARAYRQLNDLEKAEASVRKLIAEFPKSELVAQAHYRLGEYCYLSGDFREAAAAYRKVTEGWPESPLVPYALHELGCAEMDLDDHAAAERALTTLLEQYPEHEMATTARLSRGMARHRLGKYAPAVEDLQAFLGADIGEAEKADARYLLGLCQVGLGQHEPAVATFRALLQESPEYAKADSTRYQLAWALKLSGNEPDAAREFEQLATEFPESRHAAEAHYHVGEFMYAKKDYGRAAVEYYNAMQKGGGPRHSVGDPRSPTDGLEEKAAHKLGWSYYHQGQYDNAQKTFHYQRVRHPEGKLSADAAFMEGESLFKQDKFQEALDVFEQVDNPSLSSDDLRMLHWLHAGQAAAQLGQWQRSLELLENCTSQFPDSPHAPQALYEQGWAYQKLEDPEQAIKLYEKVIGATDTEVAARAQFMIGEVQFAQKDYKEAIKSYYKVMYGYSYENWQSEATFEAARCFEVLQNTDQAVKHYRELLEKFPTSSRVPVAKERIQQLTS